MIVLRLFSILTLIAINGFFAAVEFSLVAIRHSRIRQLVKHGNPRARVVEALAADMGTVISGVQVGITLTSLALGYLGELTLAGLPRSDFPRSPGTICGHRRAYQRIDCCVCFADGAAGGARRTGAEEPEPGAGRARRAAGGAAIPVVFEHVSLGDCAAGRLRRKIREGPRREDGARAFGGPFGRRTAHPCGAGARARSACAGGRALHSRRNESR